MDVSSNIWKKTQNIAVNPVDILRNKKWNILKILNKFFSLRLIYYIICCDFSIIFWLYKQSGKKNWKLSTLNKNEPSNVLNSAKDMKKCWKGAKILNMLKKVNLNYCNKMDSNVWVEIIRIGNIFFSCQFLPVFNLTCGQNKPSESWKKSTQLKSIWDSPLNDVQSSPAALKKI